MKTIEFQENQIELLVRFLVEAEKQGLGYKITTLCDGWEIEITDP